MFNALGCNEMHDIEEGEEVITEGLSAYNDQ